MAFLQLLKKASLVGAFFVVWILAAQAQAGCLLPGKLPSYPVQKVVDGDTLRLEDGRSVRLIGLNTPELAHYGRPTEAFAQAAKRQLQSLLASNGGRVSLQVGRPAKDHYGRILAHAFDRSGRNLEAQLLADGLGYFVAFAPVGAWSLCQQAAEQQARKRRLGLWARSPVRGVGQIQAPGFAVISGRVQSVARNRGGLWLEVEGDLVLQVTSKRLQYFDVERLQKMVGKNIEARGWLIDRAQRGKIKSGHARWLLSLSAESMLEVLP